MNKIFTLLAVAALAVAPVCAEETTEAIFENYLSDPAEGADVNQLEAGMYKIAFPEASVVSDNSDNPKKECKLRNESTGKTWDLLWSSAYEFLTGNSKNGFQFLFQIGGPITEKGNYTVTFPAGAFTTDNVDNAEFVTRFSIGMPQVGVEQIEGTPVVHVVYDMEGRQLDGDLSKLPAGLYIIDGKKTILR